MKSCQWLVSLVLAISFLGFQAIAQKTDPVAAGVTPLTANFDVWPDSTNYDEDTRVIDMDGLGPDPGTGRQEFVVYGQDEDSGGGDMGCGPVKTVISKNGIEIPKSGGFVADDGFDFFQTASIWGAQFGASAFGFFSACDADFATGNFVGCIIVDGAKSWKEQFLDPGGHPFAAFAYLTGVPDPDDGICLYQRFDRNCQKVSNMNYGRNVPAGNFAGDDDWGSATRIRVRNSGCAILSNGNTLHGHRERMDLGDPAKGPKAHFGLANDNGQITLHSVTNPAASAFVVNTTNTFRRPDNSSFHSDNSQGMAAGEGWFSFHAPDQSALAVFKNDGSRITQIFGINDIYNGNAATLLGKADRTITDGGNKGVTASKDLLFIPARYADPETGGILRPCVLRFRIDVNTKTVIALSAIIADDDYTTAPMVNVETGHLDVTSNQNSQIAVIWRNNDALTDGPPVVRAFDGVTGAPLTDSFYVSSLVPTEDNDSVGDAFCKVGFSGNDLCCVWSTVNGLANLGKDCYAVDKPIATIGRVFQLPSSDVGNWDLY